MRPTWEVRVLRARAEGERRRAGQTLDRAAGRRLHPLVQRRPLAVRRHDSFAAQRSRSRTASAIVLLDEQDQSDQPARAARAARAGHCATSTCTYGRGRDIYDVRGRVAHEAMFNPANGSYPGAEQSAGLLAVHDVDARPRLGDARFRRAARVPGDGGRCAHWNRWADTSASRPGCSRRPERPATHYLEVAARRWRAVLGFGRARSDGARRLGQPAGGSVQRSRARGQLRGRHRRAGPAAAGSRTCADRARRRPLRAGRAPDARDALRSGRPVLSARSRRTRASCCTRSTIAPTAGTTCRTARRSRAENRASGATITRARPPCTSCGWPRASRT